MKLAVLQNWIGQAHRFSLAFCGGQYRGESPFCISVFEASYWIQRLHETSKRDANTKHINRFMFPNPYQFQILSCELENNLNAYER
jgi:hypothetical protein